MRTHSASRAVLLCLLALAPVYGPVKAQSPNSAQSRNSVQSPNNGKPGQFTDGQNGTPSLAVAPAMIVDKNNMREDYEEDTDAVDGSVSRHVKSLKSFYRAAKNSATYRAQGVAALAADRELLKTIRTLNSEVQEDALRSPLPYYYSYIGAQTRVGTGKPIYAPNVIYGDVRNAFELGVAEYLQSAYTDGASRRDSLGLSLKYIPQSLAAYSLRRHDEVTKILREIDDLNLNPLRTLNVTTVRSLYGLLPDKELPDNEVPDNEVIRGGDAVLKALDITAETAERIGDGIPPVVCDKLQSLLQQLDATQASVLGDFADGTRRPAAALVVGDQLFPGGDIFSGGATVSRLYPFRKGASGVTAVAAVQYFQDSFRDRGQRGAERLGFAAIYQDTILKLTTYMEATPVCPPTETPASDAMMVPQPYRRKIAGLGPPWHYKVGLEYTSPVLGLHETGAVFARYRWTPSYFEITTTYGSDGLRRSYLDVSVGKSFTF